MDCKWRLRCSSGGTSPYVSRLGEGLEKALVHKNVTHATQTSFPEPKNVLQYPLTHLVSFTRNGEAVHVSHPLPTSKRARVP